MSNGHTNGNTNGGASGWDVLATAMDKSVKNLEQILKDDSWWQSFVTTDAIIDPVTLGVKSAGDGDAILVTVSPGAKTTVTTGPSSKADFTLLANGDQWEQFMRKEPKAPYTSFVGLQGMNIKQKGVGVEGDSVKFAQYAHLSSRLLDKLREGMHGPIRETEQPESDEDYITGRYIYIRPPVWGRSKVFVETSGNGPQEILFCHTAGSDSRQYHGVMNDSRMRERFTMYAFDLPAHGRSFPYETYIPGSHTNTEDAYIGSIREVIRVLKLNKPILCGASMAGQICVVAAIRAEEVGVKGTIPLQGSDYLKMNPRNWHDKSPTVNQSLFNPDWILHMCCPHAPSRNRLLIWHGYSAQSYGLFHGDLDLYFDFDIRDRVPQINTEKCPIYFLTGEYDWSTTPEMAESAAKKIKGAKAVSMKNLGHFPATEDPATFIPYLLDAVDWINETYKG